jgi:transposase
MGTTRCGISAKQIQRETGVSYKTAWRMLKQIRTLMGDDTPLTGNKIEMDETYTALSLNRKLYSNPRPQSGRARLKTVYLAKFR